MNNLDGAKSPTLPGKPEDIQGRVILLVAEQMGIEEKEITPSADLWDDIGCDSLDKVELVMNMEDEFNLPNTPDDDLEAFKTVGDVTNYVLKALAVTPSAIGQEKNLTVKKKG